MLSFNDYQAATAETAIYPGQGFSLGLFYVALKLNGEAGELAEHVGKAVRDDNFGTTTVNMIGGVPVEIEMDLTEDRRQLIKKEIGDVLWYLARAAEEIGENLEDIAAANLEKLRSRKERGVLGGSGDLR